MTRLTTLLETKALTLKVGGRTLIETLDWEVKPGEFWCVLGRNGAGKSSLLNVLSGLVSPAAGAVYLGGRAIASIDALSLARTRGLLMQQVVDSFSCPVFDAVAIARTPLRVGASWDDASDVEQVHRALERVGMLARASDDVMQLSGGERQRVALAALLAQDVPLMLLDEPTSHQDVGWQRRIMQLLRSLSHDRAVVASCHDINLALQFSTHLLVLGEGHHWVTTPDSEQTRIALTQAFGCNFEARLGLFART
jgi:iron complex transport system ATP-binding protein